MTGFPPFRSAEENSRFGALAARLTIVLNALWLLCVPSQGWSAAPAPVTIVDVMALYTPAARAEAGGTDAISAQIELAFAEANFVFENSRANLRARLVLRAEISYGESAWVRTDLERLRAPNDGFLDAAHSLREQYAADVVCLITSAGSDFGFYGLQGPSAANAFSVIRRRHLTGDYFFPVVLSFNFGCQLERPYADSVAAFPFSYGYTALTDSDWFSSVEAFDGNRLPYFSNPDLAFGGTNGVPSFRLGVPEGLPGAANNVKTLNLTAPIVAAFRGTAPQTVPPQVVILSPTNMAPDAPPPLQGTNIVFSVRASDADGEVRRVDFLYSDASNSRLALIGTAMNPPFALVWSNVPDGQFQLFAQATDELGATAWSAPVTLTIAPRPPSAPPNDAFASATQIFGTNTVVTGWNAHASSEPDEPNHAGVSGGHSVWWRWTAPESGKARFRTEGSEFNTVLAVYSGEALSNLVLVAQDYFYERSEVLFRVEAGATYRIAVDGYGDAMGDFTLSLDFPPVPPNDDFADRIALAAVPNATEGDNRFATHEPGEPLHGWNRGRGSLWWEWTAPLRGAAEVLVSGSSDRQRFVAVYSGTSMTNLQLVGRDDGRWEPARVMFDVEAGQTFAIAVDSSNYRDASGPFTLQVVFHSPPSNDNFVDRAPLVGNHLVLTNSNVAATAEPGEPAHNGSPAVNTLWWSWTAPSDGLLILEAPLGHALAAYTGAVLANLTSIAGGTRLVFPVQAGTSYAITADGAEGEVVLELLFSSVRIARPADGADFVTGAAVPVTVTTTAADGLVERLELSADGVLLMAVTNGRLEFTWTNAPPGPHTLTADAFAADGLRRQAIPVQFAVRPPNDDFTNSVFLVGTSLVVTGANFGATSERDEPCGCGSIWWSWTAPATGSLRLSAQGDTLGPHITIYRGNALVQLDVVAVLNPSWFFGTDTSGELHVQGGTQYHIMVNGSFTRPSGNLTLYLAFAASPVNDDFENRLVLSGLLAGSTSSNTTASAQAGETNSSGRSVWWTWTAPRSGPVSLGTAGSSFPLPRLSVYSGTSISNLVLLADGRAQITFDALAGNSYEIAVDANGSWVGDIRLALAAGPPENDNFANRIPLFGTTATSSNFNLSATHEPGEQDHLGFGGTHSIWWSWTAPANGILSVRASRSGFTPIVAIYSGSALASLTSVGGNAAWLGLVDVARADVAAGVTYAIAADGMDDAAGLVVLDLEFTAAPANDDFAQRVRVEGTNFVIHGSNLAATREPGEPMHAGAAAGRSVWWSWTAPFNGRATLMAEPNQVIYAVYKGSNVAGLTPVLENGSGAGATFLASAGTTYPIAVDGHSGFSPSYQGDITLQLDLDVAHVEIVRPTNGAVRLGTSFSVEASVSSAFPNVQRVDFFATDVGWFASASNAPYVVAFTTANEGYYTFEAVAIDILGRTNRSLPVQVLVVPEGLTNDNFADRAVLAGTNVLVSGSNAGATTEPGEPAHAGTPPNRSLWWSYTAPANGGVTVTLESNPFNTAIQIYTGTVLTNLNPIIGNWSNGEVNFNVVAGREYLIVMNAFGGIGPLSFRLEFQPPPPNDNFADRIMLVGSNATARGTTVGASKEPGEPNHAGHPGSVRSVWWSWTAPVTGPVILDSGGSGGVLLLAVYNGTAVSNLTLVANPSPSFAKTLVRFTAQAGTTYHIAADSYFKGFDVVVNLRAIPPPVNDHFTNRIQLTGWSLSITGHNYFATGEAGEPMLRDFPGGSSVWWRWTPPASGAVRFSLSSGSFGIAPQVRLFRGNSLTNLVWEILNSTWNDSWFGVAAGTEYQIRLDGYFGEYADFVLELRGPRPPTPPPNDNFADRIPLAGAPITVEGTTVDATLEPGEPNTLGGSVWWSWTAPVSGEAHVFTTGSPHITPFAVFVGTSVTTLTEIARAPFPSPDSVRFPVVAGTTYEIAAVSYLWTEPFLLNIEATPGPAYNDAFANRILLAGFSGTATGSNVHATLEPGETNLAGGTGRTVWWSWTAPGDGQVNVDLTGSQFTGGPPPGNVQNGGPLVAVYTGPALGALQLVASNTTPVIIPLPPATITVWQVASQFGFQATAGTTYHFSVDGANGSLGFISLQWSLAIFPPPPVNDNFANRLSLSGIAVDFSGSTVNASQEVGEPDHAGQPGGHSIWWTWTAPQSGPASIVASGATQSLVLAVYTGNSLANLTPVVATVGARLDFAATAGVAYQVAMDVVTNSPGVVALALRLGTPPSNDSFSGRVPLPDFPTTVMATNLLATSEPSELLPGGAGGRTLWWTWTAPTNATVSVNLEGSVFQGDGVPGHFGPLVSIYEGNSLATLSLVAGNSYSVRPGPRLPPIPGSPWFVLNEFSFEATGGVVYQISVDGVNGSAGEIVMRWQAHPHQPPLNDHFANRIALTGASISLIASNRFATREPGEPLHAGEPGGASVWWTWTAPLAGKAWLTVTAPFDIVAGVYLGNSLGTLTTVASGGGQMMFDCVAGTTYQIAVDGVDGASGEFQLELSATSRPANDRFTDRVILSGSAVTVDGTTVAATRELGEALNPASMTGASVWYSWTAPSSGDVTFALAGWEAEQPFSIYVGSAVSNLFFVAQASNEAGPFAVRFYALAGLSYQIAVSDKGGTESAFTLTLNAAPPPPRIQPGALSRRADGAFRLRVLGTNAQSFAIQASTDLVEWNTLAIDTLQGDVFDFIDGDAVNLPQRFYRVLPLDAVFTNGPLRLTDPTTYPSGFFALSVRGQAGLPFVLEASEDFENWTRLTARQIVGESFRFGDGDAPAFARRFYRALPWP